MTAARRTRWAVVAAAVVAVAGAGLALAAANGFGFDSGVPGDDQPPPATGEVVRQDLVATSEESGELVHAGESALRGRGGTITWLPAEGAVVERGGQLLRHDEIPVVLLYGTLPAYRSLSVGDEGADVRQLEENLAALGYTGFDVDERFGWGTAEAVMDWQDDLGLEETGVVDPSLVHYAPGAVEVTRLDASVGEPAEGELLTVASRERVVRVDLDESDRRFAVVGASVRVTLPDGTAFGGTVSSVATVVVPGDDSPSGGSDDETVLRVTVTPDDQAAAAAAGASTATVAFTADRREGVLTVPVTALLALAEGGYAVEVATGEGPSTGEPATRLVAVDTGLFADGRVEISGEGVAEGDRVVIPG